MPKLSKNKIRKILAKYGGMEGQELFDSLLAEGLSREEANQIMQESYSMNKVVAPKNRFYDEDLDHLPFNYDDGSVKRTREMEDQYLKEKTQREVEQKMKAQMQQQQQHLEKQKEELKMQQQKQQLEKELQRAKKENSIYDTLELEYKLNKLKNAYLYPTYKYVVEPKAELTPYQRERLKEELKEELKKNLKEETPAKEVIVIKSVSRKKSSKKSKKSSKKSSKKTKKASKKTKKKASKKTK